MSLLLLFTSPQDGFQGYLDEVAVYPQALPQSNLKAHYNVGLYNSGAYSSAILADAPTGFWRFEDSVGAAIDSSGSGYNGVYAPYTGVVLRSAGVVAGASNQVSLYFREVGYPYLKQLDLDGGPITQANLDALGHQPNFADQFNTTFIGRAQTDIEPYRQIELDAETQLQLDRVPNLVNATWIEVTLKWSASGSVLTIKDNLVTGYTFSDFTLDATNDYILFADIEDSKIRVRIYPLDHNAASPTASTSGAILWDSIVYDTTATVDTSFIKRRRGRIGWYAHLADGDAYLYNIRPRKFNFAEYRSHPLNSITPVKGAQIFVGATPDRELFDGWYSGPYGGKFTFDNQKSQSGNSIRVSNDGTKTLQGVSSTPKYFDTFEDMRISFDLLFPASALVSGAGLECFLYGENERVIPLRLPDITPDKWQHIDIYLTDLAKYQTGYYALVVLQSKAGIPTDWYIDNASIKQSTLTWAARGQTDNAWGELRTGWIPFRKTVNDPQGGVVFSNRGTTLQVKGQALMQDVVIDSIRTVPQYATFGRFIWTDQKLSNIIGAPVPDFTVVPNGRVYVFSGAPTTSASFIISYSWSFGDGTSSMGQAVTHTYGQPGTYVVGLSVIDSNGQYAATTQQVTVV